MRELLPRGSKHLGPRISQHAAEVRIDVKEFPVRPSNAYSKRRVIKYLAEAHLAIPDLPLGP